MNRRRMAVRAVLVPWLTLALSGLSGCHGGNLADAADAVEIEGRLLVKGNEPHLQWVLAVSSTEQWELLGLDPVLASPLQLQHVKVKGRALPATPSTARLPLLRVLTISSPAPASPR